MPGRIYTSTSGYRYGFNGKESDLETATYDYGFRIYDSKLGRFLSLDPLSKSYPWNSPYSYAEGDPIDFIDLDGLEKPVQTAQSTFTVTKPVITPQISRFLKEEALRTQVVEKLFKIITPDVSGYLDTKVGVDFPETVKATINQYLIISGTDIQSLQLAIIIPNDNGDEVRGIVTTTFNELDQIKVLDPGKDKIKDIVSKSAKGFTDLSKMQKTKSGKYLLKFFGKTFSFLSKTIKVVELIKEVVDAKENIEHGEIPVVGMWIQSNPAQNSPEITQKRTVAALIKLAPSEEKKVATVTPAPSNTARPDATDRRKPMTVTLPIQ